MTTEDEGIPFGVRAGELAAADPTGLALVVVRRERPTVSLTWAELDAGANRWGRALLARGAGSGDRIALAVQNSADLVLAVLASWKIGAVPVPVRWDLPDWERMRVLAVIDAAVVVDDGTLPRLLEEAGTADDGPLPATVSPASNGICSSGSTGTPKVIVNTRPGVWIPAMSSPFAASWDPIDRPQVILVPAPMYHTNGFATLMNLLGGDRLVVMEKFDAVQFLDAVETHHVTTFTATPTMLQRIAAVSDVEARDLSSIVWILQGAAMMPPALLRRWFALLAPDKVFMAYGMTEGLGLTALRGDEWLDHPGSVGTGYRGTEIRILDEQQRPVPVGEHGDVYLRSPLSGGYDYRGGAPLLPTTADGFGTAGDIGRLDEDGYLYLADRRVDMIVSGGANVFPAEVESALSEHPDIADVVVIGLADPEWGQRVHAVVEPRDHGAPPSAADVIAFAKSRLASYKVPKTVEIVEAMPRSAATKVSRIAMVAARQGPAGATPTGA